MSPRLASLLADAVMLVHFGFVLFVIAGALLVLRWPRVAWAHVPCAMYGAAIELWGWVCPLTPLENRWRRIAGEGGFDGGFIEHYVGRILYPGNWSDIHLILGVLVILLNVALYGWVIHRRRGRGAR